MSVCKLSGYCFRADRWLLSSNTDQTPRAYHGTCTMDGLIYIIGGFDGNEHFNTVRSFNPVSYEWREHACMYYPRCYVSVAMHGKIVNVNSFMFKFVIVIKSASIDGNLTVE